ncbi:MAG: DNA-protecting protein DprA, partial [Alphaproteobacteria bacterium]|nr:DNA-protecting protein DprA [Alphaproteobacteria bacterium]
MCLARTTHVGPVTYHSLMRRFGSAAAALEALPHMAMRAGAKQKFVPCLEPDARREWDATKKMGGH